jgi:hypothetical protein
MGMVAQVISALRRLKQEDQELETTLGYKSEMLSQNKTKARCPS